jgi:putative transposase
MTEYRHSAHAVFDLKYHVVWCTKYRYKILRGGRGRIERFFRTVSQMFLSDLDTAVGSSRAKPALTLDRFDRQFRDFLLNVYHRNAGAGTETPPVERWEAGGCLPRMPHSPEQLDLLLICSARMRKVRPDGIHFEGLRYLSPTLAAYVGEDVMLRFDPRDMGEIRVFHRDQFLGRAISVDLAGNTIPLREIVRARNLRRKELRTLIENRQQAVDTLLAIRRGPVSEEAHVTPSVSDRTADTGLRRYRNE